MFALQDEIPFSFQAELLEGDLEFLSTQGRLSSSEFLLNGALLKDPSSWKWKMEGDVSNLSLGLVSGGTFLISNGSAFICADSQRGLTSCRNLVGILEFGPFQLPFRGVELNRLGEKWFFDFRLEHRFCDLLRLKGEVEKEGKSLVLQFDREATQLLDVPLGIQRCLFSSQGTLEVLEACFQIPWDTLASLVPHIKQAREFILPRPFSKEEEVSSLVQTSLKIEHVAKGWELSHLHLGGLFFGGIVNKKGDLWTAEQGMVRRGETDFFTFSGEFDASSANIAIDAVSIDLKNLDLPFGVKGRVEGAGSVEWRGGGALEAGVRLRPSSLMIDSWVFDNRKEIRAHYSQKQGLLVEGVDFTLYKESDYCLQGRVALLQFDFQSRRWVFDHTYFHAPSDSFQSLLALIPESSSFSFLSNVFSPRCDLEVSSSFEFAANGSSFSCLLLEGLIPLFNEVRQVKNVELQWNSQRLSGFFQLRHGGRSFDGGMLLQIKPVPRGRFFLESLNVEWELDPRQGFVIHSIDGSCGGFEASFYKEQESKSLLGSLWCQFDQCADFFSL
jgi:hypothetical protein